MDIITYFALFLAWFLLFPLLMNPGTGISDPRPSITSNFTIISVLSRQKIKNRIKIPSRNGRFFPYLSFIL